MRVTIRPADPGDYDRIINLVDAWWGGRHMSDLLPRLFFVNFRPWTYVAVRDEEIVGFLAAVQSQTNPDQVYCHFIGIEPSSRGHGLGEALYQRLFADAASKGCKDVLAVTAPTNRGSIAFHSRVGFLPLPGPFAEDGTPYSPNYDGHGEHRAQFLKRLHGPLIDTPSLAD